MAKKTFESMLDENTRREIKSLIMREVVPAIGCTETGSGGVGRGKGFGNAGHGSGSD